MSSDYIMTATLTDKFTFEISLMDIPQDNQHLFKDCPTKINIPKKTAPNSLNKLLDLAKTQFSDALKIQR